jgi:hypothetical protein
MVNRYQRRHYEEAARLLRTHPMREHLYRSYVNKFAADNPAFDEKRFAQAVFGHGYKNKSLGHGHESGIGVFTRALAHKRSGGPSLVDNIMAYESGKMSSEQESVFFRENRGVLSGLQGHYGRELKRRGML